MTYATTITHPVEDKHMSPQEAEVVKLCITSMVDVFKSDVGSDPSEIIQSLAASVPGHPPQLTAAAGE